MFGFAMSSFARKTIEPSTASGVFILLNSSRLSSTGLFLYGDSTPACVGVPFCSAICSLVCSSMYALPFSIIHTAKSHSFWK